MPKPNGAPIELPGIKGSQPNISDSVAQVLDALKNPSSGVMSLESNPSSQQPNWGAHSGTDLSANPNNNFMLQALGGQSPGYDPNSSPQVGVPNANTPAINSQTTPSIGNMPQANQGLPLSSNAVGRPYA